MERLGDKLVLLVACLPALVGEGTPSAPAVALLLVAVTASAVGELLGPRGRVGLALGVCTVACAVPEGVAAVTLAAYELGLACAGEGGLGACPLGEGGGPLAGRGRWVLLAAPAVPLAAAAAAGAPALLATVTVLVGGWLGLRAGRADAGRLRARAVRDELRAAELELARRNRELEERAGYEVRLATLSERARIAREIHDNVGHLLTRAVVQAEAQRVVHAANADVAAGFAAVADTARAALDEVRSSVHDLSDDALDLSVALREVAEAAAHDGCEVTCHVEAVDAPAEVAACLVAVCREAVANAQRHAASAHVSVRLVEQPGLWRLTVENDGLVAGTAGETGGMGLASMEERLRALGGALRAGQEGSRWVVRASIPRGRGSA